MSTVLIVDDDDVIRKFMRRIVEKEGFDVIEAANGAECLERFRSASPAIVVMDIIMPEKDGLSTIQELKKLDPQAKVVAISGGLVMTPEIYLDEAGAIGADILLAKPIDREQFIAAIRQLLTPAT